MRTVLDTNVLSELRLPNPDPNVTAWFAAQPQADLAIASFSVAEIEYGIARIPQSGSLATQLTAWLNAIVATQLVLPLDADAARIFGRLLAVPALRNLIASPPQARKPRFAGDLAIAATADRPSRERRNAQSWRLSADRAPLSRPRPASIRGLARRSDRSAAPGSQSAAAGLIPVGSKRRTERQRMAGMMEGKVVVVTGAGGGIGREIAHHDGGGRRQGHRRRHRRLAVRRGRLRHARPSRPRQLIEQKGGAAEICTESVADWGSAQKIIQAALDHFGRIDARGEQRRHPARRASSTG